MFKNLRIIFEEELTPILKVSLLVLVCSSSASWLSTSLGMDETLALAVSTSIILNSMRLTFIKTKEKTRKNEFKEKGEE